MSRSAQGSISFDEGRGSRDGGADSLTSKVCLIKKYQWGYGWDCADGLNSTQCVLAVGIGDRVGFSEVFVELRRLGFDLGDDEYDSEPARPIFSFDSQVGNEKQLVTIKTIANLAKVRLFVDGKAVEAKAPMSSPTKGDGDLR